MVAQHFTKVGNMASMLEFSRKATSESFVYHPRYDEQVNSRIHYVH